MIEKITKYASTAIVFSRENGERPTGSLGGLALDRPILGSPVGEANVNSTPRDWSGSMGSSVNVPAVPSTTASS